MSSSGKNGEEGNWTARTGWRELKEKDSKGGMAREPWRGQVGED